MGLRLNGLTRSGIRINAANYSNMRLNGRTYSIGAAAPEQTGVPFDDAVAAGALFAARVRTSLSVQNSSSWRNVWNGQDNDLLGEHPAGVHTARPDPLSDATQPVFDRLRLNQNFNGVARIGVFTANPRPANDSAADWHLWITETIPEESSVLLVHEDTQDWLLFDARDLHLASVHFATWELGSGTARPAVAEILASSLDDHTAATVRAMFNAIGNDHILVIAVFADRAFRPTFA